MTALLDVRDLQTHVLAERGAVQAVDGVSFSVNRGEVLAIVGESGSGKSVTGLSVMGLIDRPGKIVGCTISYDGQDLTALSPKQMRALRGNRIAMIFQDPMMTLNPVLRVDTQMIETLKAHRQIGKKEAWTICRDALGRVGIPAPDERMRSYPHQFSGGMRQRVAIAIALLNDPDLLIADEPTTALDVTIQAQILALVQSLVAERGMGVMWVTHDLSVVAGFADRVAVMYAGEVVEEGPVDRVIAQPTHPYTLGLIGSVPSRNKRGAPLAQIPGSTPSPVNRGTECRFKPRCRFATDKCTQHPPLIDVREGASRCWYHDTVAAQSMETV